MICCGRARGNNLRYDFEWDTGKARRNLRKHGVTFERAADVFLDPFMLTLFDEEHSTQEDRWVTIGKGQDGVPLVLVHTFQETGTRTCAIRIISPAEQRSEKRSSTWQGELMKKEYDFSKGVRGKFHRPKVRLNLPIHLDDDVADFVRKFARRRKVDAQTAVNRILRTNKEILRTLQ
jgi:uncharacterized DUF497 family protein